MNAITPTVKNLLIINALLLLLTYVFDATGAVDLTQLLGLHHFKSEYFRPFQFVTHMFMHGGFFHLFFNMYALWMFGKVLETVWGGKRFLIYYLVTGLGAAALHTAVSWYEISKVTNAANDFFMSPTPAAFGDFIQNHLPMFQKSTADWITAWTEHPTDTQYIDQATDFVQKHIEAIRNVPTVGASGAVFGVLLAFGMLFPNVELFLMFVPIPIKAKYFVIGYGAIELIYGVSNIPGDNVAHFAHLGGMLFGFILIKYWNKTNRNFY